MIKRIYIEKKIGFDAEAENLLKDLKEGLKLPQLSGVRIIYRYDIEGIDEETYERAKYTVFADAVTDNVYDEEMPLDTGAFCFAFSYLPGQYDQRADTAAQCIGMLNPDLDVSVVFAKAVALIGDITDADFSAVKKYIINPVDAQEVPLFKPGQLKHESAPASDVAVIHGFIKFTADELLKYKGEAGFAMSDADLFFVQEYFKKENRDPTITELKAIDTYWSDHCRHTTFLTNLTDIQFEDGTEVIQQAFDEYIKMRNVVYGGNKRDICLMDIACIGAKYLKKKGLLDDLEESDEVNACSINIKADVDGKDEDWLLMFKNETHNHPTEIEPFGGASTCLGGAIRDPLSGRAYVYQAMRVTGAGDPKKPVSETLPGKLPQRKITTEAAEGYSSYGNQIGLTAGHVSEIYHEGYVAKRMEMGALIGAVPAENVVRGKPVEGDVIILVGGRTGRDGCGGATGSSKGLTEASGIESGAEVQKGDPLLERNIVRLFRRKDASRLIKKCNDFGAGGVSVCVGELADSIDVNLDLIPVKYAGLDGTELAISESQERMAVLVSKDDEEKFIALAAEENLEAAAIAEVTGTGRFRLFHRGKAILDLSREFLNSSGVTQQAKVLVGRCELPAAKAEKPLADQLSDLNCCSQKGLVERFDSTIGAATVLLPLGGRYQLSPALGMAAKLPVLHGETNTASLMAYGFDPVISEISPFHGAMYAVIESITKIIAMGGDISNIRLSFQEFFERMNSPESWGKPFAALLGALEAQRGLLIPSIGGKDSMSGTFVDLSVPPMLASFAVDITDVSKVISTEFKKTDNKIILVNAKYDSSGVPDLVMYKEAMKRISKLAGEKKILAANTVGMGGIFISLVKMAAGNMIGFKVKSMDEENLVKPDCTALVLEISKDEDVENLFDGIQYEELGATTGDETLVIGETFSININDALEKWAGPLEGVFPAKAAASETEKTAAFTNMERASVFPRVITKKPGVLIPVFPGTIGEDDTRRAFEKAGAEVHLHIIRNLTGKAYLESIEILAERIGESRIIVLQSGFNIFANVILDNEKIKDAIENFLINKDGLMLGLGSGFAALLKTGLLPYGKFTDPKDGKISLAKNKTGRHVSRIVTSRVASVKSPWFSGVSAGDIHSVAVSSGEGRFAAGDEQIAELIRNGQIAAQYADFSGVPSMGPESNPFGSAYAIEALSSPDGRIMGMMGHSERIGENLYKNVPGNYDRKIFESGAAYFGY